MNMAIQHNLASMFSQRQLGITTKDQTKSLGKLASGYRINRASDDAAGLAISEKMRKSIRALRQGEDNIQDGISLVRVADGALNEVSNMLQRLNEITVKALNDPLTEDDRDYIQIEVERLKEEISTIADTTTFNELKILKGNPKYMQKITDDKIVSVNVSQTVNVTAPSFLTIDNKSVSTLTTAQLDSYTVGVHSDYKEAQEHSSSERMLLSNNPIDPPGHTDDEYWGGNEFPKPAELDPNATYRRDWTESIEDNYAVKIGFEQLKNSANVEELFNNVLGLLGTTIGSSCGTCWKEFAGLSYVGSVEGVLSASMPDERARYYSDNATRPDAKLDISEMKIDDGTGSNKTIGIFDAIRNLAASQTPGTGVSSGYNSVQALGEAIAKALSKQSVSVMKESSAMTNHFSRVVQSEDGMGFIIYDYRDSDVLQDNYKQASAPSLRLSSSMKMTVPSEALVEGTWGWVSSPLKIVCSDGFTGDPSNTNNIDHVPITLPYLSLYELDLDTFNVAEYQTTTTTKYSSEYLAKYNKWKRDCDEADATYQAALDAYYKTATKVYTTVTHDESKVTETYIKTPEKRGLRFNDAGEAYYPVIQKAEYATREVTIPAWTEEVYAGTVYSGTKPNPPAGLPEPQAGPGDITITRVTKYIRPNLERVKKAIEKVSGYRASLGVTENRLEHAYRNNTNKEENTQSAESIIRDTDMAAEMVTLANRNIIVQAGQSMLANSNHSQQGILTLLQ